MWRLPKVMKIQVKTQNIQGRQNVSDSSLLRLKRGGDYQNKTRNLSRTYNENESENNTGCVCHSVEQVNLSIVLSHKPYKIGRYSTALVWRNRSRSPTHSTHSPDNQENDSRTSSSSSPSSRLEGPNMGTAVERNESCRMDIEEPERSSNTRTTDEEDGCLSSTRETACNLDKSLASNGEVLFKAILQTKGYPIDMVNLCESSFSPST
ncbi:uncharacterized protein MONOS_448 [Monocercomonoides exilis]|uniref:uncharacterized protein n=1 Tax=Monocercomonoides exilis TaxID=2049356 RepID=UPI00355A8756|nr:hypothetical protein MONOS_448 [Monocercomonoides exilis]|eukprot:MONOS_448.1-p1 / transcript=MONOS_448.1 / gene=MONOS_448 / organism=Monocercomonoides_exilis_PA203 / gene_product=unspecified product / transcript_product=unspecified product / location=Mono_scaffold00007:121378-122001(-) / protein_length=208 / sequence_SO=supercontig / SO=protein_coding / is_pseudo=false